MSTVALPPYAPLAPAPPAVFINPAQVHSNTTPAPKKRSPPAKRKHADDTPDESGDSATQPKKRDGPKKKKAVRACFHCQKAHLTCDDSRPCQRCVKLDKNCTEGHRKKAKYLLDDDELEELKRRKSKGAESTTATTTPVLQPTPTQTAPLPPPPPPPPTQPIQDLADPFPEDSLFTSAFDSTFSFGSEAANLEYSILSAILGNPSPPEESVPASPVTASFSSWPSETLANSFPNSPKITDSHSFNSPYSAETRLSMPPDTTLSSLSTAASPTFITSYPYPMSNTPQDILPFTSQASPQRLLHSIQSRRSADVATASGNVSTRSAPEGVSPAHVSPAESSSSPALSGACVEPTAKPTAAPSALQSINDRVTAPYDYTEGYHFLMKHLPGRFEKNDILRIVRALAIFRPSLIALQMPLSVDDEIFLEKCFQRSLIELEKLISFSGTPTVVWRRTGEICLVAPEFSLLTDWTKEELLGKKKYIYELFEKQSVVEYWENFASHAFENTTQSVYSHCVLLKPNGAPVPTTFCFSIRRDLFDLPSVVIGQWLPLL